MAQTKPVGFSIIPMANVVKTTAKLYCALGMAFDLVEDNKPGHVLRCCWLSMKLGEYLNLSQSTLWELYYACLLKDIASSSIISEYCKLFGEDSHETIRAYKYSISEGIIQNSGFILSHLGDHQGFARIKQAVYLASHRRSLAQELAQKRSENTKQLISKLGFSTNVQNAVANMEEMWNGKGNPNGLRGKQIPLLSQIISLCQMVDELYQVGGQKYVTEQLNDRKDIWFSSQLIDKFYSILSDEFWQQMQDVDIQQQVLQMEPHVSEFVLTEEYLDEVAATLSTVIDNKCPLTHNHSINVALYADAIAQQLELSEQQRRLLRRAALLHELGKLGISNLILDKPSALTEEEWQVMYRYPSIAYEVLAESGGFSDIAHIVASHQENVDGSGYPNGLTHEDIPLEARIISVASKFEALIMQRPYRNSVFPGMALNILHEQRNKLIDPACLNALLECLPNMMEEGILTQ